MACASIKAPQTNHWLVAPIFDLLFVCGLAPWIFALAGYLLIGNSLDSPAMSPCQPLLTGLFIGASLLIGESHQFTSIMRYFGTIKRSANSNRIKAALLGVAGGAVLGWWDPAFSFSALFSDLQGLGVLFFPAVLIQHICGQALAIGLIYCDLNGFRISNSEKARLRATTWMLAGAGAATIAQPFASEGPMTALIVTTAAALHSMLRETRVKKRAAFWIVSSLLLWGIDTICHSYWRRSLEQILSPAAAQFMCVLATIAVIISAFTFIARGCSRHEWLPKGAALLWGNLAVLILIAPLCSPAFSFAVWLFVPLFFHATQHWAMAWHVRKGELSHWLDFLKLVLPVQFVSLAVLFFPLIASHFGKSRSEVTLSLLWSMLIFYMHYFADRIVWRPEKGRTK